MISTTSKWKDWSAEFGTFHIKATIDNGTTLNLTDEDFMSGSVSITDSVSGMGAFNVGNVITNSFNATLNNFTGKFNSYNLAGATISVQFGIVFEDSTEEWIDRGTYTLEKPTSLGSTIKVVGYDDMDKMNKYYLGKHPVGGVESDIVFPLNAETLAMYLCDECGVDYAVDMWGLDTFQVDEFEYNESTTCRQVLSWVVQIAGGYARVNNIGKLECKAFNKHEWTSGTTLNGGTINPWESVSAYSGGTFSPWSSVTDYDGGSSGGAEFTLSKIKSLDVYVEDITVTGVRAFAYNTVDEFDFDTAGSDGYILALQNNPLIDSDNTSAVATRVNGRVGGLSFRPFNASIFGDPSIEAGDVVALQDYLGNEHVTLITSLTYSLNQAERIECNAETPEQASMQTANPSVDIIAGATRAAYDYITAKKISADVITAGTLGVNGTITATDLEITGGDVGGFTILNGKITTSYTMPYTYTSADYQRIQQIILGNITPTQDDYNKYDITGDGKISAVDYVAVKKAVDDENGVLSTTITIDPSSYTQGISMVSNIGSGTYIGTQSIRTPNLTVGGHSVLGVDSASIQGSGWSYQKQTNNKLECWYRGSASVTVDQQYGALYFGHITPTAYPVAFQSPPSVSVTVESANEGDIFVGVSNTGTASQLGKICCYCATTYSGTVYVNIHAIGRWQ